MEPYREIAKMESEEHPYRQPYRAMPDKPRASLLDRLYDSHKKSDKFLFHILCGLKFVGILLGWMAVILAIVSVLTGLYYILHLLACLLNQHNLLSPILYSILGLLAFWLITSWSVETYKRDRKYREK